MPFAVNSCYATCTPFQNAAFVIRDWQDDGEDTDIYGMEAGKKYLKEELSSDETSEQYQATIDGIKDAFQELHCCLLPDPGNVPKKKNKFEVKGTTKLLLYIIYCLFCAFHDICF